MSGMVMWKVIWALLIAVSTACLVANLDDDV